LGNPPWTCVAALNGVSVAFGVGVVNMQARLMNMTNPTEKVKTNFFTGSSSSRSAQA